MNHRVYFLALVSWGVVGWACSGLALQLRAFSAARHVRINGFPSTPSANPTFLHAGVDLTGVGWDSTFPLRQVTLVTPRHFVAANHFRPGIGTEIRFLSSDGTVRSATVDSLYTIPNSNGDATDVLIGRLSAPIPPSTGVRFLSAHLLDTEAAYIGQTLGVLGQPARGGRGVISAIGDFGGDPITGGAGIKTTRALQFTYSNLAGSVDDAYAEGGDSGSPSFVVVNGKAAVVGTHTAILTATGSTTTFDAFLPAYVSLANTVLEADGYHLTPAAPKSTTLSLGRQISPAVVRAGYPVTIDYVLSNTGVLNAANNVRLDASVPGIVGFNASGTNGWIIDPAPNGVAARRGGLAAGGSATISVTFTPPVPVTLSESAVIQADEAASTSLNSNITVVESFRSWSTGLADPSPAGDSDGDGVSNLLEYAQGGDPAKASRQASGTTSDLGLSVVGATTDASGTRLIVRFLRRTDAAQRLLDYRVESSADLNGAWTDSTAGATTMQVSAVAPGLESADLALPASTALHQFVRLRVNLSE